MPVHPRPTPIFHITAIDNLASIASESGLLAKNQLDRNGVSNADIAYQSVQGHRSVKRVPLGPGGNLHDYVPFYFAPRSPMLKTIDSGNVPECKYRQDDLAHLKTTIEKTQAGGLTCLFTNQNATLALADFFDDIVDLREVDWDIILESPQIEGYCKYWFNKHNVPRYVRRMEKRMAEFLVYHKVPVAVFEEIGVRTQECADRVNRALTGSAWNVNIRVVPGWYY